MAGCAYVVAAASTPFGRRPDVGFRELTGEIVTAVLDDAHAGDGLGDDVDTVWFGNCLMHHWGQPNVRGQMCLVDLVEDGTLPRRVPVTNVEGACATGSLALHGAVKDVLSGQADVVLALGVEKMVLPGSERDPAVRATSLRLLEGSTDNITRERVLEVYRAAAAEAGRRFDPAPGRSFFMDTYAVQALLHMQRYGTTQEHIAIACAKTHGYGAQNPVAQYRFTMTPEEVLADREVAYPFTRAMCAPVGDGAAGALVVSDDWLAAHPSLRDRAVRVRATAAAGGTYGRRSDEPTLTRRAAQTAYRRAGLTPEDIDVAEVHDATSFSEILQVEMLGFCPEGKGGPFVADGATGPGGTVPVNTSGGLVSKGHPIGATGLSMVSELVRQLRGEAGPRQVEGARIGLAENGGGVIGLEEATCAITILERC